MQRLKEAAEKAKIELSAATTTSINLPYITAGPAGPLHLDVSLTRAEFQRMTQDLLDRCKGPFEQAIKDAGVKVADVDHVILVGGSTRMPAVTDLVKQLTGTEPNKGVNPDEVVAVGAALQAGVLKGEVKDVLLLDVTPLSPGHRDQGRHLHQADRAQHHDPDQALRGLHHGRRQPAVRADPGLPGRARDRGVQQEARHLRADRPPAGAARRAADRGHLRHRRQRHRARQREGPGHRQGAVDDDHRRLGAAEGRHRADDARRPGPRRRGQAAPRGGGDPQPRRGSCSGRPRSSSPRAATSCRRSPRTRSTRRWATCAARSAAPTSSRSSRRTRSWRRSRRRPARCSTRSRPSRPRGRRRRRSR